jgi:hypothetical protein
VLHLRKYSKEIMDSNLEIKNFYSLAVGEIGFSGDSLLRFKIAPENSVSFNCTLLTMYLCKMWDQVPTLAFLLSGIKRFSFRRND